MSRVVLQQLGPVICREWSPSADVADGGLCALNKFGGKPSAGMCHMCNEPRGGNVIIQNHQGSGDGVALSAAIRDLHLAHPGKFSTWYAGANGELFHNSPYIQPGEPPPSTPAVHVSVDIPGEYGLNRLFLPAWHRNLGHALRVDIPVRKFGGDLHLSEEEKIPPELPLPFIVMWSGGKTDFTVKWSDDSHHAAAVKHFAGRVAFIQVGSWGQWNRIIPGAVNMIGKTSQRDLIRLVHHGVGVVSPVSFGMHLAAALDKPAVVIGGGAEHPMFYAYPRHQVLHVINEMACAPCWRMRVSDCPHKVSIGNDVNIAGCMSRAGSRLIEAIEAMLSGAPGTQIPAVIHDDFEPEIERRRQGQGGCCG